MRLPRVLQRAAATATIIALALIAGFALRDRSASVARPSPSQTTVSVASPVPSTPSASPAATAAGIWEDNFGFVVTGGDGPPHATIRSELARAGTGIQFAPEALAVSPDGTQIAFWARYTAVPELHLLTAATGAEQALVTLTGDQRAGSVAWSTDGGALLYSIDTGSAIGGGPIGATLKIYELTAGGRHGTTIATETNTGWYRPITWDRSANLAVAGVVVEGGGMAWYVTVRVNSDNTFNVQRTTTPGSPGKLGILMQSVRASSDAKFVLGVDFESGDIKWWQLDDVKAMKSQAGAGRRGAQWRPGTHQIGFLAGDQFWLGDVDKAGSLGLCCTAFSGAPAGSTIRTFRADGTAVILGVANANPFLADYTLVRFGNDPKVLGDHGSFQDLSGLIASVRLR